MHTLNVNGNLVTAHAAKEEAIFHHFNPILGAPQQRATTVNWRQIQMPTVQGGGLDNPFTEDEVFAAIMASPAEKAPGPDGFSGIFFRSCWPVIKGDIMLAFQ